MEWWMYIIIGYVAGFFSPIAILLWIGRKQLMVELRKWW